MQLKAPHFKIKRDSRWKRLYNLYYNRMLPKRRPPKDVALSVAIGIFIGILPTWGIALFLTFGLLALLKLPKIPGLVSSFIATPPTQFGIFYPLGYGLGWWVLRPAPLDRNFLEVVKETTFANTPEQFKWFFGVAWEHFLAYFVGTAVVAIVVAVIGGILTYFIMQTRYKKPLVSKQ